jgi:hypothetical protein
LISFYKSSHHQNIRKLDFHRELVTTPEEDEDVTCGDHCGGGGGGGGGVSNNL